MITYFCIRLGTVWIYKSSDFINGLATCGKICLESLCKVNYFHAARFPFLFSSISNNRKWKCVLVFR